MEIITTIRPRYLFNVFNRRNVLKPFLYNAFGAPSKLLLRNYKVMSYIHLPSNCKARVNFVTYKTYKVEKLF